ncbi:MAG: hypothetical protein M4579_000833 [Chaenotheca gracillima]|nr:MAG: hypothetical protein M4579_000833 [Chaenotheca gracillima]
MAPVASVPVLEAPFVAEYKAFRRDARALSINAVERQASYAILDAACFVDKCAMVVERPNSHLEVEADDVAFYLRQVHSLAHFDLDAEYQLSSLEDLWYATCAKLQSVAKILEDRISSERLLSAQDVIRLDNHDWPRCFGPYTAATCLVEMSWRLRLLQCRRFRVILDDAVAERRAIACVTEELAGQGVLKNHPQYDVYKKQLLDSLHLEAFEGLKNFDFYKGDPELVFGFLAKKHCQGLALENAWLGQRRMGRKTPGADEPQLDAEVVAHREETYLILTQNERSSESETSTRGGKFDSTSSGDCIVQ